MVTTKWGFSWEHEKEEKVAWHWQSIDSAVTRGRRASETIRNPKSSSQDAV